jgi:hypothetical protein
VYELRKFKNVRVTSSPPSTATDADAMVGCQAVRPRVTSTIAET